METIFVQRIMKLFLQPLLQEEDFAEYVAKVVISVGIVFESLKPTLNDCSQQVNDELFVVYRELVGVEFGSPFTFDTVAERFRQRFK